MNYFHTQVSDKSLCFCLMKECRKRGCWSANLLYVWITFFH